MRIEKYPCIVRALLEPERRAIRRSMGRARHRLKVGVRNVALFGAGIFVVSSGITSLVARNVPPFFSIAAWFTICAGLVVWAAIGSRRDLINEIHRLDATLSRNEAKEVRVQSEQMVEFEEEEDEGACYAFQLSDDRTVFVRGQDYYPSAKFPNTDFSLASIYDENGNRVKELIYKRGQKLRPIRTIPGKFKSEMLIPDHLEVIEGKLSELERLLTAAFQTKV